MRGRVLPSTLEQLILCAEVSYTDETGHEQWAVVEGESNITHHPGRIERVYLMPDNARAFPATVQAILQADLIVAGPGSFFTSVMPNLLVPAIRRHSPPAPRISGCNVATQPGETDDFTVSDTCTNRLHTGDAFNVVRWEQQFSPDGPASFNGEWVRLPMDEKRITVLPGDLLEPAHPWRQATKAVPLRGTIRRPAPAQLEHSRKE